MLPQLTVYAKILCLLMVVMIAGATPEYMFLQSACSSKFVRIVAKNGTVFADDNGQSGRPQTFTIEAFQLPKKNITLAVAIRCKETDMYLCFDKNWKIKGMKRKGNIENRPRCNFIESLTGGYFRYQSVVSRTKYLGFIGSGKPINYKVKRYIDEKCYNFQRPDEGSFQTVGTPKFIHNHRHKHGLNDQRKTRNRIYAHRQQNIADQQVTFPSQQIMPSHFPFINNTNNLSRYLASSVLLQNPLRISNEVHTTTQFPSKNFITRKQIKPSKRHGKTNKKTILYESRDHSSSTRHHYHYDYRNNKQSIGRSAPAEIRA
ncbi:uncharacterized protein LOC128738480 [Sabethes cyaneus]|uniref:uncharacterized protein LOC128738480 n=1 Tax=Sabethes cyaneus TaxID=53552 RepID=UPI00237EE918|nr:uncharacterized protein LOC128738480 [Sabethes cyaneus]